MAQLPLLPVPAYFVPLIFICESRGLALIDRSGNPACGAAHRFLALFPCESLEE
jgi:hypothetical protein